MGTMTWTYEPYPEPQPPRDTGCLEAAGWITCIALFSSAISEPLLQRAQVNGNSVLNDFMEVFSHNNSLSVSSLLDRMQQIHAL